MHLTATRITPESFETDGVLFDVPMTMLPGRIAVCMFPAREKTEGGILLEGQESAEGSKYQPDFGIVAKTNHREFAIGDIVGVRPYDGLWLTHRDYDWIPEGRQLRIYPTSGDSIFDSVEVKVEA